MVQKVTTKLHQRKRQPREEQPSLWDFPPFRYFLMLSVLLVTLFVYRYFLFRPSLGEEVRGRQLTNFKPAPLPDLKVDGQAITNARMEEGFRAIKAQNPFEQRKMATLRKYESVRFVGDSERSLLLARAKDRNDNATGQKLREAVKKLGEGKSTVALFNVESLLEESPRSQNEKEIHLYAWQLLVDEYRERNMVDKAQNALNHYFSLLQEVLPDASPEDRKVMEEAVRRLRPEKK